MINIRFITNIIGKLLMVESFFLLVALAVAIIYKEGDIAPFVYSVLITLFAGLSMVLGVKVDDKVLARKDGYFIVTFTWLFFTIFGCLPYLFSGTLSSPVDAFFETMAGFTTTGSSVIRNIEDTSHAILFWRSLTQWMGGMGIIVLLVAILPSLGVESRDLYIAEVPGPTHDKFSATFKATARHMWILYLSLTLLESVLLHFGGMSIFDSICHSLTTVATGGFSTKSASIAHWDSAYIQYVITIFMFVSGINFALLYSIVLGNPKKLYKDEEFRLYCTIVLVTSLIISGGLYITNVMGPESSLRNGLFQVISIITTTGYATSDYIEWPAFLATILFLLLFFGASAGSTSGGLKCVRISLLFKNSFIEMKRIIHPNGIINPKYNGKTIHPNIMTGVMGFFVLYMVLFGVSSIVISLFTNDIATACSATIASLSNVGPGFGGVGPMENYADFENFAKIYLALLMLVGRLEVFTVLVLFSRSFWKK